ncbi:MAG: Ribosomal protein S12 methylthiotransferase RimO [bacterium ADurb.Bin270]|jgi:radical SAM superfamily enzyme YgiQ (UPF0313 family)|nr:radical SAM protein [Myxococcales bacterium]OQA60728.1 MAG: Ribosomal protein S12 methylthiotransferase RimO [bacterium ADurb.Bin270]HQG13403.1 radical SAM protein [bacterium]HQH79903.1 radical SAM protein [bacterium]
MKILLVQPPIRDFYRTVFREYPIGLMYLASSLRKSGFQAEILDARRCRKPKAVTPYDELMSIAELAQSGRGPFCGFKHFGLSYEEISRRVLEYSPDIVCVSSMFTPYLREVIATAAAAKKAVPSCHVMAGGHHATADPLSLLESGAIDSVFSGEGEVALPELLRGGRPEKGIINDAGAPFRAVSLDVIPFPLRDILPTGSYLFEGEPYVMILTSRGCPHDCSFCSVHSLSGKRYRRRSVGSVIEEIDRCVSMGVRTIDFQDDNFLFERDRAFSILKHIADRHSKTGLRVMASNGLNVSGLTSEMIDIMRRAGFRKLDLAIATGDVGFRNSLHRPESIGRYEQVLQAANDAGLSVTTYVIIGIPAQPIAEMRYTIEYLRGMKTLISPSVFYNVPGMPIFNQMKKYEYVSDHVARRSSTFNCFGEDFEREDIISLIDEIREYNLSHLRS